MRWLAQRLFPLLVIVWVNGLFLRLTLRDSVQTLAPLYYATPWPVLAALTLPIVWKFRRIPKAVFAAILGTHFLLAAWIMEDWRSADPSHDPADLRVVHWNVAHSRTGIAPIARQLLALDADIIALAEPMPVRSDNSAQWRAAMPGYAAEFTDGNLLCLVRGEILSASQETLGPASRASRFDVRVKGRALRILQADLIARPASPRREPLARLAEIAASLPDQPLIVLGDFNTPRDSVHFAPLRKNLANTFETAGTGCGDTWPMLIPMLSLDQVWCGHGLKAVRCRHGITFRSDHRPVLAELAFAR